MPIIKWVVVQINAFNPFFRAKPHSSSHVNVLWNKKEFVYFCWLYNYDYWLIRNIYWGKYFLWEITRCEDWDWHWFHWRQQLFWSCTNCKALFSCPNTALYCRWQTEPLLILEHNTSQLVVRELPHETCDLWDIWSECYLTSPTSLTVDNIHKLLMFFLQLFFS